MLARQGIIAARRPGRHRTRHGADPGEIERGEFVWSLDDEDVHLNIEKRLTALVGDAGKRLHTGRAQRPGGHRHPPVAARRDRRHPRPDRVPENLLDCWPNSQADTPMPGFTHLQVAQPVTFGHHLMAYSR
jgi:argininosuccinate lyase